MEKALEAYRTGNGPVVIVAPNGGVIHGKEALETVAMMGKSLKAFVFYGVDVHRWNTSNWPEVLEAARELFMHGVKWILVEG
jgi:hypothetical protein